MDATAFRPYKGNSVYTRSLVRELALLERFKRITIETSIRNQAFFATLEGAPGVELRSRESGRWGRLIGKRPLADHDLFHRPGGQEPIWMQGRGQLPGVFTFHDANYLQGRGLWWWKVYKLASTSAMLNRTAGIVFISSFARDEFCRVKRFARYLERVPHRVIWNGCNFPSKEPAEKVNEGPWLCFANQTHKRADLVIAAFEKRWQNIRKDEKLLVIGAKPPGLETMAPVEFRSGLSDTELINVVAGAKGLLFPSEYEGFGLPVLEAAVSGVPVIANALPAVREVFGESVSYAPYNAVTDYVKWMARFDHEAPAILERARLAWSKAQKVTWRRCAEQVADFYDEVNTSFHQ